MVGLGTRWLLAGVLGGSVAQGAAAERRCGWLENPTPANWWLRDSRAEWELGIQGGYQAPGMDDMPDMTTRGWVETNVRYGYGCACITGMFDAAHKQVTQVMRAEPLPLARCRADRSLPKP